MSYYAIITKVKNIHNHSNADRLNLGICFGNQVVIGKDITENDLGIYFPTDGQLSQEYCDANKLQGYTDEKTGEVVRGYFDQKRRVRTQKFRGEKSDGFWMPISSLAFTKYNLSELKEGDQIVALNGINICNKYITNVTRSKQSTNKSKSKTKKSFIMFHEHSDTEQLAYNIDKIKKGSVLYFTEKVHGTSGRTGYIKNIEYPSKIKNKINRIFNINIFKNKEKWEYITGTRRVILDDFNDSAKIGFYGSNDFRKIYHDKFINTLKKGETIYYEIVGWVNKDLTVMGIVDNTKIKDKEFIKRYGNKTIFKYGCKEDESDIWVYRITMSNEDGEEVDYSWNMVKERCNQLGIKHVPEVNIPVVYDGIIENLKDLCEELCDGPSTIDPSHIREGIVVRIDYNNHWKAYKHKNFNFKVLEGIIKDSETIDIEEAQDINAGN